MDKELLDTLIKLASLGASGICIFAIFWIGWLIMNPPANPDPDRHKTLRFFMGTCVMIALISAASGIANAMINSGKIADLGETVKKREGEITALKTDQTQLEAKITNYKIAETKSREAAKALELVLESKEAAELENPSSEIGRHIKTLRGILGEMNSAVVQPTDASGASSQ